MLIKAASLVLIGTAGILLEVPFVSSESLSLVIWGGTLLGIAGTLRFLATPRKVAGASLNLRLGPSLNVQAARHQEVTL